VYIELNQPEPLSRCSEEVSEVGKVPGQLHVRYARRGHDEWLAAARHGVGDVVAVAGLDVLDRRRVHLACDYASDEAVLFGVDGGLGAVLHVELDQDRADVVLHRVSGNEERLRDFRVGVALRKQAEDLELAVREGSL
jgi:hypothetical protein